MVYDVQLMPVITAVASELQAADVCVCVCVGLKSNCGSDAPLLSSSSLENILSANGAFANALV